MSEQIKLTIPEGEDISMYNIKFADGSSMTVFQHPPCEIHPKGSTSIYVHHTHAQWDMCIIHEDNIKQITKKKKCVSGEGDERHEPFYSTDIKVIENE